MGRWLFQTIESKTLSVKHSRNLPEYTTQDAVFTEIR